MGNEKHASKCKGANCHFEQVYLHHEIMCAKASTVNEDNERTKDVSAEKVKNAEHHKVVHVRNKGGMALRTVKVKVSKANGDMVETYGLLDDGSSTSFIENEFDEESGHNSLYGSFILDTIGQSVEVQG